MSNQTEPREEQNGNKWPAEAKTPEAAAVDDQGEAICETDIVFDCPHCGKNLVIDYRGAGLVTNCTSCGRPVEVPIPEGLELDDLDQPPEEQQLTIMTLRRSLNKAEQRNSELEAVMQGLKERRGVLEKSRAETLHRFAEIRSACEVMQRNQMELSTAIGRVLDVITRE